MWIIPALACLAFAVFTMLAAPSLLTRGTWQVRHPQLALGLWHGAVLGGSLALLAAVALSVVAVLNWEHDEGSWLSGFEIALAAVFASAGLIAMFGWGFIITRRSGRAFADGRRANDELRDAARVLSYRDERIGGALVRFVESPSPHALAAAGPRRLSSSRAGSKNCSRASSWRRLSPTSAVTWCGSTRLRSGSRRSTKPACRGTRARRTCRARRLCSSSSSPTTRPRNRLARTRWPARSTLLLGLGLGLGQALTATATASSCSARGGSALALSAIRSRCVAARELRRTLRRSATERRAGCVFRAPCARRETGRASSCSNPFCDGMPLAGEP